MLKEQELGITLKNKKEIFNWLDEKNVISITFELLMLATLQRILSIPQLMERTHRRDCRWTQSKTFNYLAWPNVLPPNYKLTSKWTPSASCKISILEGLFLDKAVKTRKYCKPSMMLVFYNSLTSFNPGVNMSSAPSSQRDKNLQMWLRQNGIQQAIRKQTVY